MLFDWVLYIQHLICFKKNKVQALLDSGNKVNVITPGFALKLGLKIDFTNIGA